MIRQTNPDFMNGVPELLILNELRNKEMYWYELARAIRDGTAGTLNFSEGVIYPTLHTLEVAGALKSRRKAVNGRSRVYYALTADGSRRLKKLEGSWTELARVIHQILDRGARGRAV